MQILIADDDKLARSLLQFQLEHWGHSVIAAENGVQAWELLQTHDCPIVITDWSMPGMTGLELLQKIRAADRAQYVYSILLTSHSEQSAMITGLNTGADDYLTKPVDKDELKARLQPGLRISDLERRLAERQRDLEERNNQLSNSNSKMKRNLDAAAQIQQAFLPGHIPGIPEVEFFWHYSPCDELGGDMLNVLKLDEEHIGVYVLDVSGHGVQAALLAVTASRLLSQVRDASSVLWERAENSAEMQLRSPAAAIQQLNERMSAQPMGDQFFTLLYGILNRRTGEFRYSSAGHPPPVHVTSLGRATFLFCDGLPIGITETDYDEHLLQLRRGDRLFFYSDGITESMNASDELFGNERLIDSIQHQARQPLSTAIPQVATRLQSWCGITPPHDDVSLLALQFTPPPAPLAS